MILQGLSDSARSSAQMRMPLWGNLALSDPIFLLLVPLALLALFWGARRLGAARIPVLPDRLPRSPLQRWLCIPTAFKAIALTLAVLAMARPLRGDVRTIYQY